MTDLPRGIRNNNPGNMEDADIPWQGMETDFQDDVYLKFQTPEWGIRAMAVDLFNKFHKDKLVTITALINKWAPPNDNDTFAYVRAVSSFMELGSAVPLDLAANPREMGLLIRAIIKQENGKTPDDWSAGTEWYTLETIAHAMTLAKFWGVPVTADMLK